MTRPVTVPEFNISLIYGFIETSANRSLTGDLWISG